MSAGLNYERARRLARISRRSHEYPPDELQGSRGATKVSMKGWRIEWPEEFPVTVTTITAREIDHDTAA